MTWEIPSPTKMRERSDSGIKAYTLELLEKVIFPAMFKHADETGETSFRWFPDEQNNKNTLVIGEICRILNFLPNESYSVTKVNKSSHAPHIEGLNISWALRRRASSGDKF